MAPPVDSIAQNDLFRSLLAPLTTSVRLPDSALPRASPQIRLSAARARELRNFDEALRGLRRNLETLSREAGLRATADVTPARDAAAASISSSQALALDPYSSNTTLRSLEEVNTVATSYGLAEPIITGNTTTQPSIGGVYDGTQGDDVLTFEFRQNSTVGSTDKLRVRIRDGTNAIIDNLNFTNLAAGTELSLSNGLTLSLSPGDTQKTDTFTVSVSTSTGTAVDPTKAFDGSGNDAPRFEAAYDVIGGSFDVNGVNIAVGTSDSIDDIVARITASAAGVEASFDATAERVVLTQKTSGSTEHIVLANDTSGFLAATKLAGASEVLGDDERDPFDDVISNVASLAAISSGSFAVNGTSIAIDTSRDSLSDIVNRINTSGTGAFASYDSFARTVSIESNDLEASLSLDDGGTSFFSTLQIQTGLHEAITARPLERLDAPRFKSVDNVRKQVFDVARSLNSAFPATYGDSTVAAGPAERPRARLLETLARSLESLDLKARGSRFDTGVGLVLDLSGEGGRVFEIDSQRLARSLAGDAAKLTDLLFADEGADGRRGFIPSLLETLESLQSEIALQLGRSPGVGSQIDTRA